MGTSKLFSGKQWIVRPLLPFSLGDPHLRHMKQQSMTGLDHMQKWPLVSFYYLCTVT